jgi:GST-like protein
MADLIQLYTASTPNGHKISIALEELGVPYQVHKIHFSQQEQHSAEFLKINPNGKIPAIVDGETAVFESGAILIYLAEKHGKLLPPSGAGRYAVLQWLMFQMSAVGPMLGQFNYFMREKEQNPPAIERYRKESFRILGVLDARLKEAEFLAGDYSIADIATYPWIAAGRAFLGDALPHVIRWLDRLAARPAVERGMKVPA